MNGYRQQVASALRAVEVTSPTAYSWFGRRSRPLPPGLSRGDARESLIKGLQQELYRSFYSQGRAVPVTPEGAAPMHADPAFVTAISRSNTGRGGWDQGWHVEELGQKTLVVVKDRLRVRVETSDCRPARAHSVGAAVSVRRPKEHLVASPGFYTALGDAEAVSDGRELDVRVYFHMTATGAAPLVAVCTDLLNHAAVPFALKVLDHPRAYARCDSAVLYLHGGDFDRARGALRTIVLDCGPHLRGDPPALTKPLTSGVAVGEHHTSLGGSFGTSRCRMIAEGIVDAYERHITRLPDRVDAVAQQFAEDGFDLDVPYLASASTDRYAL